MFHADVRLTFRLACPEDLAAVVALCEGAKREPFSVWNENYPTEADALRDLETDNLYVLVEDGFPPRVIGTLSVCPENEMDHLDAFSVRSSDVREIARVAVASDRHGHGYAAAMMREACRILYAQGVPAVHISVARDNLPALRSYPRAGFVEVGRADLYGDEYILMEKRLSSDEA